MCSASIFRVQTVSSVRFQQGRAASFLEGTQTVRGTEIASDRLGYVETRRVDHGWRSVAVCSVWFGISLFEIFGPCRDTGARVETQLQWLIYNIQMSKASAQSWTSVLTAPQGTEGLTEGFLSICSICSNTRAGESYPYQSYTSVTSLYISGVSYHFIPYDTVCFLNKQHCPSTFLHVCTEAASSIICHKWWNVAFSLLQIFLIQFHCRFS